MSIRLKRSAMIPALLTVALTVQVVTAQQAPVNPNATAEAKMLLRYLQSLRGKHIVTGIHNEQCSPTGWTDKLKSIIGADPGLWGNDFRYGSNVSCRQKFIDEAKRQWAAGSIVTLMWHQAPPTMSETSAGFGDIQGSMSSTTFKAMVTPGTSMYAQWEKRVDAIVPFLKQLQDAKVPVLFRPYHEMNGGWFWWGKKGSDYGKLFQNMYNRYTKVHNLNNILWVFNPNVPSYADDPQAYYPGHSYVDVIGYDYYSPYEQKYYDRVVQIAGGPTGKVLAIAECGTVPTVSMLQNQPNWSWFMIWRDYLEKNSTTSVKALCNSAYALVRSEMSMGNVTAVTGPARPFTRIVKTSGASPVYTINGRRYLMGPDRMVENAAWPVAVRRDGSQVLPFPAR